VALAFVVECLSAGLLGLSSLLALTALAARLWLPA